MRSEKCVWCFLNAESEVAAQQGLPADPRPFVALLDVLGILTVKTDLPMSESGAGG
jgi:hypothetical protein